LQLTFSPLQGVKFLNAEKLLLYKNPNAKVLNR